MELSNFLDSAVFRVRVWIFVAVRSAMNYLIRIGDALSQLLNVTLFFGDNANESVSGRAWRLRNKHIFWGIMRKLIDWLMSPFELDHCEASHSADVSRAAKLLRNQGS